MYPFTLKPRFKVVNILNIDDMQFVSVSTFLNHNFAFVCISMYSFFYNLVSLLLKLKYLKTEKTSINLQINYLMIYSLDELKPKTKTKNQIFFVCVNESSTTFLYTLNRWEQQEKKSLLF